MTESLVDAMRELVRTLVREELAKAGAVVDVYSSATLPPGITSRTFGRWCRTGRVVGAVRDGAGWRCSAEAWRAARGAGPKRPAPTLTLVPSSDDAADLLTLAGLRRTR